MVKSTLLLVGIACASSLALSCAPAEAQSNRNNLSRRDQSSQGTIVVSRCVVTAIDKVQVPSMEAGAIVVMSASEGDRVERGDLIARLDDDIARSEVQTASAEVAVAQSRVEDQARLDALKADAQITEDEYLDGGDLNAQTSREQKDILLRRILRSPRRASKKIESLDHELRIAELNLSVQQSKLDSAKLQLERRHIITPISGVVVQRYRRPGEWVQPGDPVALIVGMDRLRVEGLLEASIADPQDIIGREVEVTVMRAQGKIETIQGRLSFVSPQIENNGQFRVSAEIDNRKEEGFWVFRPGLKAQIEIKVGDKPR